MLRKRKPNDRSAPGQPCFKILHDLRVERDQCAEYVPGKVDHCRNFCALRSIALHEDKLASIPMSMTSLNTYVCTIRVCDSRGDLKPNIGDAHADGIANPARCCIMRDTHTINDGPNREGECKPKRIKAGLRDLNAVVLFCISIHQPIHKPPSGGFA